MNIFVVYKVGKYMRFCFIIMDTGSLNRVQKDSGRVQAARHYDRFLHWSSAQIVWSDIYTVIIF